MSSEFDDLPDLDWGSLGDEGEGSVAVDVAEDSPVPVAAPLHPNFVVIGPAATKPVDLQVPESEDDDDRDADLLYFDIETIPDHAREHLFGLDPVKEFVETPTDALVDPFEFISQDLKAAERYLNGENQSASEKNPPIAWIEDCRLKEAEHQKKPRKGLYDLLVSCEKRREESANNGPARIKLLSVTPEYCRIVSLAYAIGNGPVECMTAEIDDLEGGLLRRFWEIAEGRRLVVFNGLSFDVPVMLVRSSILNVKPGRLVSTSPFGNRDVLDLQRVRFGNQIPSGFGLKKLCRVYGIDVPAGDVNGSQVYELFKAGQLERIKEYNKSDVVILREFHRKLRGRFCG